MAMGKGKVPLYDDSWASLEEVNSDMRPQSLLTFRREDTILIAPLLLA
jgi:hypothetical protein